MQDKLEILLNQIKATEELRTYLKGGKLERIIGNKARDAYHFLIEIKENLPVSFFQEFQMKLKMGFPTCRKTKVTFHVLDKKEELLHEYYDYFMKSIAVE